MLCCNPTLHGAPAWSNHRGWAAAVDRREMDELWVFVEIALRSHSHER